MSYIVNDELVRLGHGTARLAGGIVAQIVTASDVVEISRPEPYVSYREKRAAKKCFRCDKVVVCKLPVY